MKDGTKVAYTLWGLGWLWNAVCLGNERFAHDSISESISSGLNGRYRHLLTAGIIWHVAHVYCLAAYLRGHRNPVITILATGRILPWQGE